MSLRGAGAMLATLLAAIVVEGCAEENSPYPPGYESLVLGTAREDVLRQRPACQPDGTKDRCHDATGPAAFKFVDGKMVGLRVFVPHPVSAALLARYAQAYVAHKLPGAENKYDVQGHVLQVTPSEGGVEVAYGDDPGVARRALGPPSDHGGSGASALVPSIDIPRVKAPLTPAAWPQKETVAGVDIWSLSVVGSGTAAASLRVIISSGSTDEASDGLGTTATLADLLVIRLHREALAARVELRASTFRHDVVLTVRGPTAAVAKITNRLGRALNALAQQRLRKRALERGYRSSLQHAVGLSVDARTLEDEALGAMFSTSAYTSSPVDAERSRPSLGALDNRASGFTSAAVTVIAAGAIPPPALRRFARTIGPRPSVDRRAGVPQLPGKASRTTNGFTAAVEGIWFQTSDPQDFAQLYLLAELLRSGAERASRKAGAPSPVAVRVGGWAPASYAQLIYVGGPGSAVAIDSAASQTVDSMEMSMKAIKFETLRRGVKASFVRRLSTIDSAATFMTELVSLGLSPKQFKAVWMALDKVDAIPLQASLPRITRADRRFSMRWGGGT